MNKHTPAPWEIQEPRHFPNRENVHLFIVKDGALVAIMPELQSDRADESAANAHLIAAAPEMLAALEKSRQNIKQLCEIINAKPGCRVRVEDFTEDAREAIANAQG